MITRRQFAKSLSNSLVLAALHPAVRLAMSAPQVSKEAVSLYHKAFVLDCNTVASIGRMGADSTSEEMAKLIGEAGVTVVKSTLGGATGTFEQTREDIDATERLIEKHPDLFLKVLAVADMDRAQRERKLGIIYSFEAATMLEDKIDRIASFRRLGVRVMQLSYNRRSPLGVGCLDGEAGGLTELGRAAVAAMNQLGVALDLSHANTQTTAEGIERSKQPPVFTHAGCRSVFMHPRNKADREMKALADKGGVMGIYMLPYLTASPKQPTLADYMRHLEYALKICGEDHVGVGSDVPFNRVTETDLAGLRKEIEQRKAAGISAPGEDRPPYIPDLNTPRKMELITDALLKRGYKAGVVEKVLGTNFRRVFGEIWTA